MKLNYSSLLMSLLLGCNSAPGVDAGADCAGASVTFAGPDGGVATACAAMPRIQYRFHSFANGAMCTFTPNATMATATLPGDAMVSVSHDGNLFETTGAISVNVGLELPCEPGRCQYAGECLAHVVAAGDVGSTVEVALTQPCTLPSRSAGMASASISALDIRGVMERSVDPPETVDDAAVPDCGQ